MDFHIGHGCRVHLFRGRIGIGSGWPIDFQSKVVVVARHNIENFHANIWIFQAASGQPHDSAVVAALLEPGQEIRRIVASFLQLVGAGNRHGGRTICAGAGERDHLVHLVVSQLIAGWLLIVQQLVSQISPHLRFARSLQGNRTRKFPKSIQRIRWHLLQVGHAESEVRHRIAGIER